MRLGIFGGSFNPVHMGHLVVAQDALELFNLDRVLFVPCNRPPHKSPTGLVDGPHRLAMLEAALEGDLRFEASDIELSRGGISWSVDTARELRLRFPAAELVFIIGADSLLELHLWRESAELLKLCEFVTVVRPGTDMDALQQLELKLPAPWPERLMGNVRVGHLVGISSTDIRCRVAEGLSIRYLVHPAVEMYIAEHSLYRK